MDTPAAAAGAAGATGTRAESSATVVESAATSEPAVASPEAAAEATAEPTTETAGALGPGHCRLGVTAAAEAASHAARLPSLDCPAPLDINLDAAVLDADAITPVQSS
jgi:hypothetical protein